MKQSERITTVIEVIDPVCVVGTVQRTFELTLPFAQLVTAALRYARLKQS